ncbi:MAG: hypothetical protein IT240_04235 [Bacteroidia bacterium]|nr:hypothetical protein [Bacteroidia bacterium]MCC6768229.1 hypothetical protein [Bacteroidia bacterium]
MKAAFFSSFLLLAGSSGIIAQNTQDAIRYSLTSPGGTAQSLGMGGASGAVGGDFGSVIINPAGLGLYRSSEVVISPNLFNYNAESRFYGQTEDNSKFNFNISNLHMVLHFPSGNQKKTKGWLSSTISIGVNRTANLHQRISVRGVNTDGSIVNAAAAASNGSQAADLDPFSTLLFWNSYLIDNKPSSNTEYFSQNGMRNGGATQKINLESSGRIGETNFTYAGNYSNRLYVGGGFSIRRIVYEQSMNHIENNETDSVASFSALNYRTQMNERGSSVAFKGGIIYRANDWFRLGASAILPIDYNISRSYSSSISSRTAEGLHEGQSPEGRANYRIRQSPRVTFSMAAILKKRAIISLDYETVNYSALRLRNEEGSFDKDNENLRTNYASTGNLRVGAELRFDEHYIRTGVQLYGSTKISDPKPFNQTVYALGVGFRNEGFFVDFAYQLSFQKLNFTPYSPELAMTQLADLKVNRNSLLVSLGTRF